jgi:hypothetical protein
MGGGAFSISTLVTHHTSLITLLLALSATPPGHTSPATCHFAATAAIDGDRSVLAEKEIWKFAAGIFCFVHLVVAKSFAAGRAGSIGDDGAARLRERIV